MAGAARPTLRAALAVAVVAGAVRTASAQWVVASATVVTNAGGTMACNITDGDTAPFAAATAYYNGAAANLTGWASLYIFTHGGAATPLEQAFAAGCLEGALTVDESYATWANFAANTFPSIYAVYPEIQVYYIEQLAWTRAGVADYLARQAARARQGGSGNGAQARAATAPPALAASPSPSPLPPGPPPVPPPSPALNNTFWAGMALLMAQFDGLVAGFQGAQTDPAANLSELYLYMMQAQPDINDLVNILPAPINGTRGSGDEWDAEEYLRGNADHMRWWERLREAPPASRTQEPPPLPLADLLTDCSALVQPVPPSSSPSNATTYNDLIVAHTTWRHYFGLLRTWKRYDFAFAANASGPIAMSSSPGILWSQDDTYVTDRLVVFETTNSLFFNGTNLYQEFTTPLSANAWQRAMIANYWGTNGTDWVALMAAFNNGLYPNSWYVVDSAYFTPGAPLPDAHLLTLGTQIPGAVYLDDLTPVLRAAGYVGSYNVPFNDYVFNVSGYPEMVALYGPRFSYSQTSRALMFARNYTSAVDVWGARDVIRYNDWAHDPLALGDPLTGALSARGDLRPNCTVPNAPANCSGGFTGPGNFTGPTPFGGIDAKVVSVGAAILNGTGEVLAESGPTHDQQPVFVWSNVSAFANVTRIGMSDVWDFGTVVMPPAPPSEVVTPGSWVASVIAGEGERARAKRARWPGARRLSGGE